MSLINPAESKPTSKQLKLISEMENYSIYKFEGKTISEASDYIERNMELFKEQKQFMN